MPVKAENSTSTTSDSHCPGFQMNFTVPRSRSGFGSNSRPSLVAALKTSSEPGMSLTVATPAACGGRNPLFFHVDRSTSKLA